MKLAEKLSPSRFFAKSRKGVALVTVLTVMALTTILVLTFFSLATSEHRASNTYSHGIQAQQVAEQAVNLVIAQIREATVKEKGEPLTAWASQPGAIRLWDASGGEREAYKLYSDDTMKTVDWREFKKDFDDAKNWSSQPDHYVDLNEPVIRGEKVFYPIVHPLAATEPQWPKPINGRNAGVEGFRFNEDGNMLSDEGAIGGKARTIARAKGHVAMPVKWIYQLADGTLGVLGPGGGGGSPSYRFVPISGQGAASARNPIVARFAFWADDETTKLNINTHAGGLAWDIPKAGGELDMAMGKYQPAQREWQRYPGHPASTHLIPALAPGVLDIVNDRDAMEMLFKVVPRVVGGGSESGTRNVDTRDPKENNGLIADKEPLFPSLDDVIMRSDRTPHEFPDATGRAIPPDQLSDYLERAKFFVTANSRAPETNLFNRPRIAMWPIYNKPSTPEAEYKKYLTAFDRLIHYCSSMGANTGGGYPRYEYIFKREKADSDTWDINNIPRNRQLYDYLVWMLGQKVPGYGASFEEKYGNTSAAALATMVFDYIRSTNLHDDTVFGEAFDQAFPTRNTKNHYTFTNPRDGNQYNKGFGHKGHGQVTPIRIDAGGTTTKGMGRFCTLSGADIMVACVGVPFDANDQLSRPPRYPGVTGYNGRHAQSFGTEIGYTNLPPLPQGAQKNDPAKANWPQWLKDLQMSNPTEFEAAWDETQWNWQLAFLDKQYRDAVLQNPTQNKFSRQSLGPETVSGLTRLQPGEKLVQAVMLFNLFSPSIGWNSLNPNMQIEIERVGSGIQFASQGGGSGQFLAFEGGYPQDGDDGLNNGYVWATNWCKPVQEAGARAYGGLLPFTYTFVARDVHGEKGQNSGAAVSLQLWNKTYPWNGGGMAPGITSPSVRSRLTPLDRGYDQIPDALGRVAGIRGIGDNPVNKVAQAYRYDLVTVPFKINAGTGVDFTGGNVEFRIFDGGEYCENSFQDDGDGQSAATLVQTIELEFPNFKFGINDIHVAPGRVGGVNEFEDLSVDSLGPLETASLTADAANPWSTPASSARHKGGTWKNNQPGPANWWASSPTDRRNLSNRGRMSNGSLHWNGPYIERYDIVQSIAIPHGDVRVVASRAEIKPNDKLFAPHRNYGKTPMAHSLTNSEGEPMTGFDPTADKEYLIIPDLGNDPYRKRAPLPFATDKSRDVQLYGDFDNGSGTMIDGPYVNKPDEGNVHSLKTKYTQEIIDVWEARRNYGEFPYFSNPEYAEAGGPSYFSPNRIVSGPGMFGSLPTSLFSSPPRPWQTLLFRPNVRGNGFSSHPGAGKNQGEKDPPDHVLMDLFWMPVVEPYAISEPLSTAGKINMNFEIVPFLHVRRDTALRGVMRSEFMLCIPNKWHHSYKHDFGRGRGYHWRDNPYAGELQGKRLRAVIVEDDTLDQFVKRFKSGENAFKSATEICEIHLIPQEFSERLGKGTAGSIGSYKPTVAQMENGKYWRDHSLVGDNSRERPYTNIHTRLTTKSNTFQVHFRAQVLKQARRADDSEYGDWRPEIDTVQAEYRGSSVVERYVDPNEKMRDFADPNADPIDEFYRFRVINPRRFAP